MLEIPTALFYVATIAMVIVCGVLATLLFYLVEVARVVLSITRFLENEGKKIANGISNVRKTISLAFDLFRD